MPTASVEIKDLPAQFDDLVKQAAAGTEVIVTEANVPRAKLVAIRDPKKPRTLGLHPGAMEMLEGFDDPLPDEFWLGGDP